MKSVWLALAFSLSAAQGARAARIAVDPGTLCEVSFSASVAKGPVVEDDPALAELLPFSIGRPAKTGRSLRVWRGILSIPPADASAIRIFRTTA
jgi:hypothetical protein